MKNRKAKVWYFIAGFTVSIILAAAARKAISFTSTDQYCMSCHIHPHAEHEVEIARLLAEAREGGELPPIIRPPQEDAVFHVPDMGHLNFLLSAGEAIPIFKRVHSNVGNV